MDVREKLIDILLQKPNKCTFEQLADFLIENGVTVQSVTDNIVGCKWIPVTEMLPEEHDSIFNLYHGTPRWTKEMFRTLSDIVLVVIVFEDGSKAVKFANTEDGKWNIRKYYRAQEVTHWMPLPQPPKGE